MAERAFIAEDDGRQARAIRRALLPSFHFVEAPDTPSAQTLLRRRLDYSLIVLDVHLPGEGGLALFDEFHPRAQDALFILISADTSPRFVNYVHGKPRAKFVAKPFGLVQLRALAEEALVLRANRAKSATDAVERLASWRLTLTERRVLACHLDGRTKTEACALLALGKRTHESHVRHILAKAAREGHSFTRFSALVRFLAGGSNDPNE